jgi:hypothetical protein
MASIIKFVLTRAGELPPYYWNVPQHFTIPSAYFPPPEIDTGGETLCTYSMDFSWYIKLFHQTAQGAYSIGNMIVTAIRGVRNLIPLIAEDGREIVGNFVRVSDPKLKMLDDGAAQLTINWRSRRLYNDALEEKNRAQSFSFDVFMKSGKEISDAYAEALEKYAIPLQSTVIQTE